MAASVDVDDLFFWPVRRTTTVCGPDVGNACVHQEALAVVPYRSMTFPDPPSTDIDAIGRDSMDPPRQGERGSPAKDSLARTPLA